MKQLPEQNEGFTLTEFEKTYEQKKSKYREELKRTSAKPRIRLLNAKIDQLDSLYKATKEKVDQNSKKTEESGDTGLEILSQTRESGGDDVQLLNSIPIDSASIGNAFLILNSSGELNPINSLIGAEIFVDDNRVELEKDGSINLKEGKRHIEVFHPFFKKWNGYCEVFGGKSFPIIVKMISLTSKLKLKVFPDVDFRLFFNGLECPRSWNDDYQVTVGETQKIKLIVRGFEEVELVISSQQVEEIEKIITLYPILEETDLIKCEIPCTLYRRNSKRVVNFRSGTRFVFGRSESCAVQLVANKEAMSIHEELFVSREHFSIFLEDGTAFIQDHSSNGTSINKKLHSRQINIPNQKSVEVGISRPGKKGFFVKKSLRALSDLENNTKLVAVYDLTESEKILTHLLFSDEFLEERRNSKQLLDWALIVIRALGGDSKKLVEEARQWISE
tara:strand:+ start:2723 stop:4063 length:1341 start_codon:yes stop_codon:yes gene_type:complete